MKVLSFLDEFRPNFEAGSAHPHIFKGIGHTPDDPFFTDPSYDQSNLEGSKGMICVLGEHFFPQNFIFFFAENFFRIRTTSADEYMLPQVL